jgi:hypothetical protein
MTLVATDITHSLAERVRDWSKQERDLAIALRGLHVVAPSPSPPTPSPDFMVPGHLAPNVSNDSPSVFNERSDWLGGPVPVTGVTTGEREGRPIPAAHPVPSAHTDVASAATQPAVPQVAPAAAVPLGPFDDFIAAMTGTGLTPAAPSAPLPPPGRFMVRVAPVGKPHRATKRNYDYFEELNVRLAEQAAAREQNGLQ